MPTVNLLSQADLSELYEMHRAKESRIVRFLNDARLEMSILFDYLKGEPLRSDQELGLANQFTHRPRSVEVVCRGQ